VSLSRLRIIVGALLAIVFAGSPVLGTTCELLCARSSPQSHVGHASSPPSSHSSSEPAASADHARHEAFGGGENASHRGVAASASSRDCCEKDAVSSVSVRPGRIYTNDFFTAYSFTTLKTTPLGVETTQVAAPRRGPPPGSSSLAVHRLPLRI
jgi:hypothetical protein